MAQPPTGTVTFLFTDIEGSTRLWEQHPETMKAALARHDAILRNAIEACEGYIFKTVGDAFCAAFAVASDALAAALSVQQALHDEPWGEIGPIHVRMALHTGSAHERDADYFGPPVNRIARLLSAGHGGQVLLSLPTEELVRDSLPEGTSLRDFGERRLKDLQRPERVFQLVVWDLPADFPPLRTLDSRPNNLPAQATPLIGREPELATLRLLLLGSQPRLLTLTGPGGIGKTRLALQLAADLLDEFADGVFFVALAPLREPELVASTIAQTLGVKEEGGRPVVESLQAFLRNKEVLLVLDNFEQVVSAAPVVGELLAAGAKLKVVVTSRTVLRLYGEREFAVPPLQVPEPGRLPPAERLSQYEAVRLFIERAQDVRADFAVTNETAPAVAEICHRLDGLPLAIELAAARVRLLPPQALLARLESRLKLLTGGPRNLPARQQTLRNTIDWSYELLNEGEQRLFRRLAVFVGGCTLEAAETVVGDRGQGSGAGKALAPNPQQLTPDDVLDSLGALVEQSLLRQEQTEGEPRFTMLETIREYAWERLAASGELEAMRRRHAVYFAGRRGKPEGWQRVEQEHDNLRAALAWCVEGNPDLGLEMATQLTNYWMHRGYVKELRERFRSLLARPTEDKRVRANALRIAAEVHGFGGMAQDQILARSLREEQLAIEQELGNRAGAAEALRGIACAAQGLGDFETAKARLEESLGIQRELNDKRGMAAALTALGDLAMWERDPETARARFEEALAFYRELGDDFWIAGGLRQLGELGLYLDRETARANLDESVTLYRRLGKFDVVYTLESRAKLAEAEGDWAAARSCYEESLALYRQHGHLVDAARIVGDLGRVAMGQGDLIAASSLAEESATALRRFDLRSDHVAWPLVTLARVALAENDLPTARARYEEVLAIHGERGARSSHLVAFSLQTLGQVALSEGHQKAARARFEEALAIVQETKDSLLRSSALAKALCGLGNLADQEGDDATAEARYQQVLADCHGTDVAALGGLGRLAVRKGEYDRAAALFAQGLAQCRQSLADGLARGVPMSAMQPLLRPMVGLCLVGIASVLLRQGQTERAARLAGAADTLALPAGVFCTPDGESAGLAYRRNYEGFIAEIRAVMTEETVARAWEAGQAMTVEQAVAYALEDMTDAQ